MRKSRFLLAFLLALSCFSSPLRSQNSDASNLLFQHISLKEGLSQSTVFDIKQDRLGFIWIATAEGLNRYDGYKFVVYLHNQADSLSLPSNSTTSLLLDDNGDMWIGTGAGLARYNHELNSFTTFVPQVSGPKMRVFCMKKWKDEELIIATSLGLFRFSIKKGFKVLNFPTMNFGNTAILKMDNKLLIGADRGLYFYFPDTDTYGLANNQFDGKSIGVMLPENNGGKRIWVGTEGFGLYLFDISENKLIKYSHEKNNPKSISSDYVRSLCYDSQQRLWIGTFVGLNVWNERQNNFTRFYNNYQDGETISQNSIRTIFSDMQGGLWFGTYYGGLNYYHPLKTQFEHLYFIKGKNSLNDNVVSCMLAEPDGKVWIGTNDKGLDLYNLNTNLFEHFINEENNPLSISGNNVKALLKLDDGSLLVGTHGGGLNSFDSKSRRFNRIDLSPDPMINENVYGLVKDKNGMIWIGTLNGVVRYNPALKQATLFEQIVPSSKSMNNKILGLFIDSKERLWIGTDNGVWVYSIQSGRFEEIIFSDKVRTEKIVYCFYEQESGTIWTGTNEGLFYFDGKKLISYREEKGFPDLLVCSIQEDHLNRLWISTTRGLICLSTDTSKWRVYTESDGLQSNQFNQYSSCKTTDDKMFFGGINGISTFYPERLIDNPFSPTPIIDQLTVFTRTVTPNDNTKILKKSIELTHSIQLEPEYNVFGLEFVVPNYLAGTKNTFSYTLEGFDNEWYTTEKNSVGYSNLAPGKYTFRVKAANNNGKWSLRENQLEIEVMPYWYNTLWAKTIFIVLFLAIAVFLIRFYLSRQFIAKELELERLNNERLKEIDQAKIRFFVNVSHEFRTPLTLILSPVREMLERGVKEHRWVERQLDLIERNAERMLHLVNQALDYRKAELGAMLLHVKELEIESFVKKNFDLFSQLAKRKEFEYTFQSTVSDQKVYFDPNFLDRILANLLSNSFKYSPKGGKITVTLTTVGKYICIEVEDTGVGISKDKFDRIFDRFYQEDDNTQGTGIGLSLVKNLVEKHHGNIKLESEIGKGSKFTVLLPAEKGFYAGNELSPKKEDEIHENHIEKDLLFADDEKQQSKMDDFIRSTEKEDANLNASGRRTILLVEDDEEIRGYLLDHLSASYHIIEAENGDIAWKILQKAENIELIISDLMMPVLDGLALCKMVKQNIHYCHIPFLLLTAKNEVEDQLKGLQTGADDYIGKPFIYSIIEIKIRNIFMQHHRVIQRYASTIELHTQELVTTGLDVEFMNRAIEIVEKYLDKQEFSVEDFSREMCMSRSGLHLKLKAITGESARDFIRKVRLSFACKLLKEGRYNVTEISEMIGFTPAYFSTSFKKYAGCIPSEYQKKIQNQHG